MMKNINVILETGGDLVEIFIKHPIQHFPVLKKDKVVGHISKKKVLRFSTHQQFLDKKISNLLSEVLEESNHEIVFEEIERLDLKPIPYLLWVKNRLEIHKMNKEDFLTKHKPVGHISPEDLYAMIAAHDFPMIIFDGSLTLVMENNSAKKIRALTGIPQTPNPYVHWIKKEALKPQSPSPGKTITGKKTHKGFRAIYHLQHFKLNKGMATLVVFLSYHKVKKNS